MGLAAAAAFAVAVYIFLATHAITIQAPISKVWPWLVQLGQGRGGFYSYDWLENLFGCDIHNADRVIPQYRNLKAGDGIRIHPRMPAIPVVAVEPGRVIVLHSGGKQISAGQVRRLERELKEGDRLSNQTVGPHCQEFSTDPCGNFTRASFGSHA